MIDRRALDFRVLLKMECFDAEVEDEYYRCAVMKNEQKGKGACC